MQVKNDTIIVHPADPSDPEDFDVSAAGLERGLLGRRLRRLLTGMGMGLDAFPGRYGIPVGEYAGYESVRGAPPPAVLAYLHVIVTEPETTARAVQCAAQVYHVDPCRCLEKCSASSSMTASTR